MDRLNACKSHVDAYLAPFATTSGFFTYPFVARRAAQASPRPLYRDLRTAAQNRRDVSAIDRIDKGRAPQTPGEERETKRSKAAGDPAMPPNLAAGGRLRSRSVANF